MRYRCLSKEEYRLRGYSITGLRFRDILPIKDWRNDQLSVLRQNVLLTDADQLKYYNEVIEPSFHSERPGLILFSFLLSGECIGYGGLTNIDWHSRRAEISFLLETARIYDSGQYQKDFANFLMLAKKVAFEELGLNRLFTETFDIRPVHVDVLNKSGFILEGRMREHVYVDGRFVDSLLHGFIKEYYNAER